MIAVERIADWLGEDVLGSDGEKAGKLDEVYLDGSTPVLAEVKRGGLRRKTHLVPLDGALAGRDYLKLAYTSELITNAPGPSGDSAPDQPTLAAVADHFNLIMHGQAALEGSKARAARLTAADAAEERARELEEESRRQAEQSTEAAEARTRAAEEAEAARSEAERARRGEL